MRLRIVNEFVLSAQNKKAFNLPGGQVKGTIIHSLYFTVAEQAELPAEVVVAVRYALRRNRCIACQTMRQAIRNP